MNVDTLSILLPAFCAGLVVLSTHLILGQQVLQRGIVFIDLAIAQVASLGVVISHLIDTPPEFTFLYQMLPVVLSLSASLLIAWLSHHHKQELEAIIGCFYVVAAATVLIVLANNPHGAEYMERSLAGRIFWITGFDLLVPLLISLTFLFVIYLAPHLLEGWVFYPLFAVLITISVDLVGVYLVFSTLIMPSLATHRLTGKIALFVAGLLGIAGYGVGLLVSHELDLPGGAVIVATMAVICLLFRGVQRR